MKKFYLLLLAGLIGCSVSAQREKEIDTLWQHQINEVFQQLELQRVPNGVLLDYAMEFTDVTGYNGELLDNNQVDIDVFSNIYKTLYMGMTAPDSVSFPRLKSIAQTWAMERLQRNQDEKNTLVLAGQFYQYSKIRSDAVKTGDIIADGRQFYDAYENGIWQNPYETKNTFAVSFPIQNYNKHKFKIVLPQELWLTNQRGFIDHIEVDMGDGQGYRPLPVGQELQVNYPENGTYQIKFRAVLASGGSLFSHTTILITAPAEQPDEEVYLYTDDFNGATLRIDYAPGHTGLVKPLIIAEGFDTGVITAPETEGGENTFDDFIDEVEETNSDLDFLLTGTTQEYDLVYIDWYNGTAALQDNSTVLEKVLAYVNQTKTGNKQNVLLGQSMGGVVGRYTLARMEAEGDAHDVRLFISHDAPLQGSVLPLGVQFFSRHFVDVYVDTPILHFLGEHLVPIGFGLAELISDIINGVFNGNTTVLPYVSPEENLGVQDTPAAVQMNYEWVHPATNEVTSSVHQAWQQEFDNMGYPQDSRNIAISNGNECGDNHGFAPGAYLLEVDDADNPDFWGDLVSMIGVPLGALLNGDIELFLIGLIPGNSEWHYDFDIESVPELSSNDRRVYYGRIRYVKHFLGWDIPHNVAQRTNDAPSNSLSYASYAGGSYDINNVLNYLPSQTPTINLINPVYGFVPVVSALDARRNNNPIDDPIDFKRSYAGGQINYPNLTTEFHNFIVGHQNNIYTNFPHISFQTRNGNWLAKELQANTNDPSYPPVADCSVFCGESLISGNNQLCETEIYSVASSAENINWTIVQGGDKAILQEMGNSAILTKIPDGPNGWLKLRVSFIHEKCGSFYEELSIWVGPPERPVGADIDVLFAPEDDPYHVYVTSSTTFNAPNLNPGDQYIWEIIYNGGNQCANDPNAVLPYFSMHPNPVTTSSYQVTVHWGNCPGSYSLTCYATNGCSETTFLGQQRISVDGFDSDEPCDIIVASIAAPPPCPPLGGNGPDPDDNYRNVQATLYDMQGNIRISQTFDGLEFTLRGFSVLEQGLYILNVATPKGKNGEKILIVE